MWLLLLYNTSFDQEGVADSSAQFNPVTPGSCSVQPQSDLLEIEQLCAAVAGSGHAQQPCSAGSEGGGWPSPPRRILPVFHYQDVVRINYPAVDRFYYMSPIMCLLSISIAYLKHFFCSFRKRYMLSYCLGDDQCWVFPQLEKRYCMEGKTRLRFRRGFYFEMVFPRRSRGAAARSPGSRAELATACCSTDVTWAPRKTFSLVSRRRTFSKETCGLAVKRLQRQDHRQSSVCMDPSSSAVRTMSGR